MPLFYAYIANILDEATFRLLAIFASRAVADEWWRAVSASPHARFIKRAAPQFYAHDATQCNLSGFFEMPEFKPIAEKFRGRMLFTQLNDGLLGITIIPPQEVTDHISGGWYHIRSASNHALCWHYDAAENKIRASEEEPTRFRITIRKGLPEETILVGEDRITLYIGSQLYVYVEQSGQLKAQAGSPRDFCFRELENGNFAMSKDASVVFVDNADSTLRLMSWELGPALSPSPHETTPEHFDAKNLDVIKSSNAALDARVQSLMQSAADVRQQSQTAAAAADRELAHLKQQLDVIKSSNEALVRDSADAKQKSQAATLAAAERSREDLAKSKQLLKHSKAVLAQERADAQQKSQTAAIAAERKLADMKRQLDVMESSMAALVQASADAEQRSQIAAATAARELAGVRRQLDVMKSSHAALEARKKYLGDARKTLQVAAAVAKREFAGVKRELDVMEYNNACLVRDSADADQKAQAAEQRLREELSVMKSSNDALVQENVVAEQKSRAAEQRLREELSVMKSSKEALVQENVVAGQKLQSAVAAAAMELGDMKQQLESSKADLVQERADAEQKFQVVVERSREELAERKQQLDVLESSNAAFDARVKSLTKEAEDARQKLQTAAAATEKELADAKRQLDVMESSNAGLVLDNADAKHKSQMAAIAAERELMDVKRQLGVMESTNAGLVQHSVEAEYKSQVVAAVAKKELADVRRQLNALKAQLNINSRPGWQTSLQPVHEHTSPVMPQSTAETNRFPPGSPPGGFMINRSHSSPSPATFTGGFAPVNNPASGVSFPSVDRNDRTINHQGISPRQIHQSVTGRND